MCKFFVLAVFAACLVMATESSAEADSCQSSSDPKSGKKGVQLLQSVSTINKLVLDAADASPKEGDRSSTESVLQRTKNVAKVSTMNKLVLDAADKGTLKYPMINFLAHMVQQMA